MNEIITWFTSAWWTSIDGVVTIGTLGAVIYNSYQGRKQLENELEKIELIFDVDGVDYLLNLDMPRKHISRSEVQGILAAFQKDIKARYSIAYLSDLSFLDDIFSIQNNQISTLKITVTSDEFLQFNENKMKKI